MKVTEDTKQLAKEILNYWKLFNHHDQNMWVGEEEPVISKVKIGNAEVKVCNTTMCAAGTAVFLRVSKKEFKRLAMFHFSDDEEWVERGRELLGLSTREAHSLFFSDDATAKKLMKAIAKGDQEKFDKILRTDYEAL